MDNNDEPSPMSDIDRIRQRRLSKLQATVQSSSDTNTSSTNSTSSETSTQDSTSLPKPRPLSKPTGASSSSVRSGLSSPVSETSSKPSEYKSIINIVPKPALPVVPPKSFEEWQDDVLTRVLQVSLNANSIINKDGTNNIYLKGLVAELEEELVDHAKPFRLATDILDRALVARLSIDPSNLSEDEQPFAQELSQPLFDYLLNSWKRAAEIRRGVHVSTRQMDENTVKQRLEVLDQAKALLVSYSGLILQMPDMFPQFPQKDASGHVVPLGAESLVPRLIAERNTAAGIPSDFLKELVDRFSKDGIEDILGPSATGLSGRIRNETILTDWRTPMNALLLLTELKNFSTMITELPNWNPPNVPPRAIEIMSLLGPFARLSAFPDDQPQVAETYFAHSESRSRADLASSIQNMRSTILTIHKMLFAILNNIVRSSSVARENMLAYFATVLKANEKRAQMHVDRASVSGAGYMSNLASVLVGFSLPFMDASGSKLSKIDSEYLRNFPRIDVVNDTKINASQEDSDEWFRTKTTSSAAPNFITEIYYITMSFLHYGPIRSYAQYGDFLRSLKDIKDEVRRIEEAISQQSVTSGHQTLLNQDLLNRYKDRQTKLTAHRFALETHILHPEILSSTLQFYNFVMMWLVRLVDPHHSHPNPPVEFPIPVTIPKEFAMLPEWIIEDIADFWLFVGKYGYETRVTQINSKDELVAFIVTFLKNPKYIKNPYLKAKFVEILFFLTYTVTTGVPGEFDTALNSNPLALKYLMSALMSFYVDVEQTGASSQFYDKFNVRYNISQIIKTIWSNPDHREQLHTESVSHRDRFTRFVNMLMSDVTYLLDESLTKLSDIHTVQVLMKSAEWQTMTPQQREEREGFLRSCERQAGSYVALGNETVHMLSYMTGELVDPFMTPEIVDRLAAMLDYNLVTLVGPKRSELKVQNPEKYRFDPKHLLCELVDIYLHLGEAPEFIVAVARDGRSYNKKWFGKAEEIMRHFMLKPADEISKLRLFVDNVEEAVRNGVEEEEDLGDAPDEFLDPLMYTLMEDPVFVPTSGVTVDRSTIRAHLLGESRDPFNRAPLTMDMVKDDTEMKTKIQNWKKERLAQKRKERASGHEATDMDTSQ